MFKKIIEKLKFGSCKTKLIDEVNSSKKSEKTNSAEEMK
ncbi:hypothetical protein BD31_I2087 [Candidatus Nitrosopumilus salaria BD31]|jgi:hypothetical protein|uniref:Uncharacterized protein n=1 Tax=Candidatus Nitrosopumilus salarius BD31 TaxID=859350 RepID=I3D482_9ARCH|nr:hypothetical protein BD31_I2087 [Candidatus Nitrosopumilus salaria BD31]